MPAWGACKTTRSIPPPVHVSVTWGTLRVEFHLGIIWRNWLLQTLRIRSTPPKNNCASPLTWHSNDDYTAKYCLSFRFPVQLNSAPFVPSVFAAKIRTSVSISASLNNGAKSSVRSRIHQILMGNLALQKLSLRIHSLHPYRRIRERLPLQRRDPETPRMRKRMRQTYLATGNRRRRRTTLRRSRVRADIHACPVRCTPIGMSQSCVFPVANIKGISPASRVSKEFKSVESFAKNHSDQTTKPNKPIHKIIIGFQHIARSNSDIFERDRIERSFSNRNRIRAQRMTRCKFR